MLDSLLFFLGEANQLMDKTGILYNPKIRLALDFAEELGGRIGNNGVQVWPDTW